jgi:hypothetical protein
MDLQPSSSAVDLVGLGVGILMGDWDVLNGDVLRAENSDGFRDYYKPPGSESW